jgi:UDP-N-acetylglucosamine 1-carboxyvinyltransferase
LAATLLCEGPVRLENVPPVRDIMTMLQLLEQLGVVWSWQEDGALELEVQDESKCEAPYHLVRQMRASFCLLGPLWAKRGKASVSMPGGCAIGERPVDLHLKGMQALGGEVLLDNGNIQIQGQVQGGSVYLGGSFGSTVLGTANVLMAAVLGKGVTRIDYAAQEPEIEDLCHFLQACGADIEGVGSHCLTIRGVPSLTGCRHRVIEDRIEAGTMLIAGLMTRGEVEVLGARPDHLSALLDRLRFAGLPFEAGVREIPESELGSVDAARVGERFTVQRAPRSRTRGSLRRDPNSPLVSYRTVLQDDGKGEAERVAQVPFLRSLPWDNCEAVDISTLPYPGFPTDLQAQFMTLMCLADGVSVITEKIYPDRFIHVAELARLGAKIRRSSSIAIVQGGQQLKGATVMASDLRASAALVLAGLVATGETTVRRVYHLDRGYVHLEQKLRDVGGQVERVREG